MEIALIVVAAGSGTRLGGAVRKQFVMLGARSILGHSLAAFAGVAGIGRRVVVLAAHDFADAGLGSDVARGYGLHDRELAGELGELAVDVCVAGGAERHLSVRAGLEQCGDAELVLVHDAVRPFVTAAMIQRVVEGARRTGAAVPGVPVKDTIKSVDWRGMVTGTPDRQGLRAIQTPQGFRAGVLRAAFAKCGAAVPTDDAMLCEAAGFPVEVVAGDEGNIKITTAADMQVAAERVRGLTCGASDRGKVSE